MGRDKVLLLSRNQKILLTLGENIRLDCGENSVLQWLQSALEADSSLPHGACL